MQLPHILFKGRFDCHDIAMTTHADSQRHAPELDAEADTIWQGKLEQYQKEGKHIWDGTYYRADDLSEFADWGTQIKKLSISTIKYRYINTLKELEGKILPFPELWTNHISTGALVHTSDNLFVFGVRSGNSASSNNQDILGGGTTQEELPIITGYDLERNLRKELLEEANIQDGDIADLSGIGVVISPKTNVLFIGLAQLKISFAEVQQKFLQGTDGEMRDLVAVAPEDLQKHCETLGGYRTLLPELLQAAAI